VAMRGGVVDRPCANMVVIDHGDGWSTYYYHVISITVSSGQTVTRGQQLGGTSEQYNCGGWADGPHVHVWTTYQGTEMAIEGIDIGGWTVQKGIRAYDGCFYRDTTVLCAQYYDSITNDGVSGSVGNVSISPTRTTVNNWISYSVEPFAPNTSGQVIWRRLSGSLITVDTFTTDDAGVASGRFRVPATPGGPNQLISFIAGDTTRTALFEVAPRIKVLTDPAVRGQQVNVSLRGYAKKEVVRIRWRHPDGHWVELARITTSNTGSSNTWVTVPYWAADGANSVRGDGTEFRQQTNVVNVDGGPFLLAEETIEVDAATPEPEAALPVEETPTPVETPIEIDRSALPLDPPLISQADPVWTTDPNTGAVVTTVDLGGPHTVTTIGWLEMSDQCAPTDRIEFSLDAISWTPLELAGPSEPGVWAVVTPGIDTRWIRWVSSATDPAGASGCLAEISVWAVPVAPEPEITPTPEPTETIPDETGTPVPASSD
ncbi:MAG: M23 family metallopeptidase, partial [Thermomicrobiales bacterium]